MQLKLRMAAAIMIASLVWAPTSIRTASAITCYSGDPPAVYEACLAYKQGVGQQVSNQRQLQKIKSQINNAMAQMNALDSLIATLNAEIAAQQALIVQTQTAINKLNQQIRLGEADLIFVQADMSIREQVLETRMRYQDSQGSFINAELVLTSASFNDLMNRLMAEQQIATSDRQLIANLKQEHSQVALANTALGAQRVHVASLLKEQQATRAGLQDNLTAVAAALAFEGQLAVQLSGQYKQELAARAAIDAQVAKLAQQYAAAAAKAGGGKGVFEWPLPTCGFGCISQGFGCSTFYLEIPDPNCPYPHKIHTGIDIAGPYGTPIVAADTGVIYFYPGSIGYGNLVVMIHGNGYSTYYGHTASYARGLRNGEIVPRGTTIAYEGMTGWATGPHLHFEIRFNNVYKDPCIWLGC